MTKNKQNHAQNGLDAYRKHIAQAKGRDYWRSLEELADTPEFQERLHREFPQGVTEGMDPISRRNFLKVMGASMALAGVVGCTRQPQEKILPYTNKSADQILGIPSYYATAMPMGGYAAGLLVESHEGRPTKIEGNPDHPASLGGTDPFGQAAILSFYDPERSQVVVNQNMVSSWANFTAAATAALNAQRAGGGAGVRLLTETVTSPTLISQINAFLAAFPSAVWHQYEPVGRDNASAGARLAFGENVETLYDLTQATVILTLDADIIAYGPGNVRYAYDYATRRRVWQEGVEMSRMYALESTPTVTGGNADHRLAVQPGHIEAYTRLIAQRLGVNVQPPAGFVESLTDRQRVWIDGLIADLEAHRGTSVVVPGIEQPPIVHALAHAINRLLENFGATVTFSDPVAAPLADGTASQLESLRALNDAMAAGQVNTLIMVGSNPAYSAPADFNFAANLANVGLSIHMNEYLDETGALCTWHVPQAHFLESWGDARAYDGTVSIIQPLIAPLYDGKTALELFSVLNGTPDTSYNIVRTYWQNQTGGGDFATFWNTVLRDGVIAGTALGAKTVSLGLQNIPAPAELSMATELTFRPDSAVWDGRFSNNAWLQELPRPWTRIAWDNAALVSPRLAIELFGLPVADINNLTPQDYEALSEANGNMVELQYNGRTLQVPIWVTPGQPYRSITLHLGYGHDGLGNVADGVGFNAYALRGSEAPWFGRVAVTPVGGKYQVVSTQDHHSMEGRAIIRAGTLQQYLENPGFIGVLPEFPNHPERSQFQDLFPYEDGYSWGMVIDLNTCIACNSCVVACQAENNIPTVGKDQVAIGREMHWIRIDRYYGGSLDEPMLYQQPMACVHCELAPCEIVCPVNATVHDHEGLNVMIYNRCVGTRYCSNNCPYKVRRFNFLQYMDEETPSLSLQRNPDVTVRSRGVMEKCTYCVQRIKEATIPAKNANRTVADGEITPACAQACPTHAITFGNLNDHESRVYKLKQNLLNYGVLEQFNFFPRTTYLGRITNPNPAIGQREGADYPGHGYPYGQDAHGGESDHGEGEMHTEGGESPESGH